MSQVTYALRRISRMWPIGELIFLLQRLLLLLFPVYWFIIVLGGGEWKPWVRRLMLVLQTAICGGFVYLMT
jgi:hypothetical protein